MNKSTKNLIRAGITISIVAILIPIGFYIYDFGGRPRSENPAEWGTFGDFFGGILNPIISMLTLIVTVIIAIELKKIEDKNSDRAISASYQPQLVMENTRFYIYTSSKYNGLMPVEFSIVRKQDGYMSQLISTNFFGIDVYNIGLGAAKLVEFKFKFELDEALTGLKTMNNSLSNEDVIDISIHSNKSLAIKIKYPSMMKMGDIGVTTFGLTQNITHLLSVSDSNKPYNLKFPKYILEMYNCYLYTWIKAKQETPDFPTISIDAIFHDIENRKFEKKFSINLTMLRGFQYEYLNELSVTET
jgi:uncharacterized membrane protein